MSEQDDRSMSVTAPEVSGSDGNSEAETREDKLTSPPPVVSAVPESESSSTSPSPSTPASASSSQQKTNNTKG